MTDSMTAFKNHKILIIDCQTTGMHPNNASLLQIAWCVFDASAKQMPSIEKRTLRVAEHELTHKIKKMLHITEEELAHSIEPNEVFEELQQMITALGPKPIVLAHYAQFEQSFLQAFYLDHTGEEQLNFTLLCTQKMAKRLLPHVPSHNLKALAGFFKLDDTRKNNVSSHVAMTYAVWQKLMPLLHECEISTYTALELWLNSKVSTTKTTRYEYNIEKLTRLNLSERPGVYYMLAQDGSILYIGKATSLKSRVNSYFRGIKKRDRRKLEMLAQVWDINTAECDTPFEAALLESDEIKKFNPPYNILLKEENRQLIFYNEAFDNYSTARCATCRIGPFRPMDAVMHLIELLKRVHDKSSIQFVTEEFSTETVQQAWLLLCEQQGSTLVPLHFRSCFFMACQLLRRFESTHGTNTFEGWWNEEKQKNLEEALSLEQQLANKLTRAFIRAAEALRKCRHIRRMANATFVINKTQKVLHLNNGEFVSSAPISTQASTAFFDVSHYDRLSIVLSAKHKQLITIK